MPLTLHNRKWYPLVFSVLSLAIIAAWLWIVPDHRPELLLSGMGLVAGLIYFVYRQNLDEAKLFKELFAEFNSRYNNMSEDLTLICVGPADRALSASERQTLFSYFNLCAEEYFFFSSGYIDQRVWDSWERGMKIFFQNQRIQALWQEDGISNSYYGFRPPR
jgi:hypothetical protein